MYAVCTDLLARTLNLDFLEPVSTVGVYVGLLAWLLVAAAALRLWSPAWGRLREKTP